MAVYFEIRLSKFTLDLSAREDIVNWLLACENAYNNAFQHSMGAAINDEDMTVDSTCFPLEVDHDKWFNNIFTNLIDVTTSNNLKVKDDGVIVLDCVFGSKNRDNQLEYTLIYLLPFYKTGNIYVLIDGRYSELDVSKLISVKDFDLLEIHDLKKKTTEDTCEEMFYARLLE